MNIFHEILTKPLTNLLILLYNLFGGSLWPSIIVTSLIVLFLVAPLSKAQMESSKKMKEIQPLIDKLKKKYANDQKGLMTAQADLFKEKGINPTAGCLPIIPQIIILGVFASVLSANNLLLDKINSNLYPSLKFAEGISLNTHFFTIGNYIVDLAKPDILPISGLPFKVPGILLILGSVLQFLSFKVMSPLVAAEEKVAKKTRSEVDDAQVAMQSSFGYMFPLMTLWVGISFTSGLALYFLVSSVFNVVRQVKYQGWGGLTPVVQKSRTFLKGLGLVQ